jgi:glycosyltransferase involved in cell wall biosynthesis
MPATIAISRFREVTARRYRLAPSPASVVDDRGVKLSIFIPAYQEERTIAEVVRLVRGVDTESLGFDKEIIVVDDGSSDRTSDEVLRAAEGDPRVKLIRHDKNRGKGAAIRTALDAATGEVCLVQDADLEYSVDDYRAMLAPVVRDGARVVYGSRFLARPWPDGMKLANFVANKILTTTANALYGHRITDEATCFKLFRTDLLRSLNLECTRFEFCPEVTAKVGLARERIVEVPIQYTARSVAAGKKVRWTDGIEAFRTLVRWRLPL